jgi:nucleoside-diphosphate-sugar epimerase
VQRDWGFAGDYFEAMWLMLQQEKPDDYVIATGEALNAHDLVELTFAAAGLDWRRHVEIFPADRGRLVRGDPANARGILGWQLRVTFAELVKMMVGYEVDLARRERTVNQESFALGWRPSIDLEAGIRQTYECTEHPSTCKWLEGPVIIGARAAGGNGRCVVTGSRRIRFVEIDLSENIWAK